MLRGTPHESGIGSNDTDAHVTRIPLSVDSASHRVIVPDTELLFSAKFTKAGSDLILTGQDGHKIVLSGYFDQPRHADLVAPGGAILTADVVAKLTISQTPGQYAQAGAPAGAVAIGKVERLGGSATVQHANGTVEELKIGDNVYQGDVVETNGGSQLGMSFMDGTAFNMGASARMVLSELVYDSNSNSNSGVFSLVKGTITFVAGKVAKTGDMRVETPVATMGIRGTSVNTNITTDVGGNTVSVTYALMPDPDGHIGSFNILDRVTGAIIGTITTTDTTFVVTPTANLGVLATQLNKTPEQIAQELAVAQALFPIFLANPANFNNQNVNPQNGHIGSGTPQPGGSTPGTNGGPGNGPGNNGNINRTDGGQNGTGTGGNFTVDLTHVNQAPSVFADVPTHLVEAVSLGSQGTPTALSHITKIDLDGTVSYNFFSMLNSGWVYFGDGIYSKLGTYGAASLNAGGASAANLVADGWTNLGNGFFEKTVSFGASGNATIRISSSIDTVTYALDNNKADPLRPVDHPTETFVVPVIDDSNATASTTVVFTVDGMNDPALLAADAQGPHTTSETANLTNEISGGVPQPTNLTLDGTLHFTDAEPLLTHASASPTSTTSAGWFKPDGVTSAGSIPPATLSALQSALQTSVNTVLDSSTGGAKGDVSWTFTLADHLADFLAVGEKLVLTYTVTVLDEFGAGTSQPVTVTVVGTNDRPVISPGSSDSTSVTIGEVTSQTGLSNPDAASGTLSFTDVDLNDTHQASALLETNGAVWSAGGTVPQATLDALATAMTASIATGVPGSDSTGTGSGHLTWNFSLPDHYFDFLREGETLTLTYDVSVADPNGAGGLSAPQQVVVTITSTNDKPVITAGATADLTEQSGQTAQDTPALAVSGTLAFTDTDLDDTHQVVTQSLHSAVWPNGTVPAATLAEVAAASTFTVSIAPDSTDSGSGSLAWNFNLADHFADFLAVDETLTLVYDVSIKDNSQAGNDTSVIKQVIVTITGTNDDPIVAASNVTGAVTEQTTPPSGDLTDSGTIAFTDVDLTDIHTISPTITPSANALGGLTASVTHDTTGTGTGGVITWTYTVADSAVEYLAKDQHKLETFTITLDDGHGGTIDRTVSVTITGTNDDPVVAASNVTGAVTEQTTPPSGDLTSSGTIAFTDVDLTDIHNISPTITPSAGALGTLTASVTHDTTNTGTGGVITWNYSVADSAVEYLAKDQTKLETFTITLSDGNGGLIDRTISVTITGTNDAPTIAVNGGDGDTSAKSFNESDAPLATSGTLSVFDVDILDTVAVAVASVAVSGTGAGSVPLALDNTALKNMLSVDSGNVISDTSTSGTIHWAFNSTPEAFNFLAANQTLVLTYTVRATDSSTDSATADQAVTVTITGTNDDAIISVNGGDSVTGSVTEDAHAVNETATGTLSFTDLDISDHHVASVSHAGAVFGNLTAIVAPDTTGSGSGGVITWNYTVADADIQSLAAGETRDETFRITLNDGTSDITKDVTVTITGTNDAPKIDLDTTLPSLTATAAYTENNSATIIAPNAAVSDIDSADFDGGMLKVSFSANGVAGDQLTILADATVTVSGGVVSVNGNAVGTINAVNDGTGGNPLEIDLSSSDATPAAISILMQHIAFLSTSDDPTAATRSVEFKVVDGDGVSSGLGHDTAQLNATVNVTPVNDAPVFTGSPVGTAYLEQGTPVAVVSGVSVSDIDSTNYAGGRWTATVTAGGHAGDKLSIANDSYLTVVTGGHVMFDADGSGTGYDPTDIGTLTDGINSLTVALNSAATDAAVARLTESLRFSNATSDDPTAIDRTVTLKLEDGGGQANSGQDTAFFDIVVPVTPVNDAPVLTGISNTTPYVERSTPVTVVTSASASDVDSTNYNHGSLAVAITSAPHGGDTLTLVNNAFITVDTGGTVSFDSDGGGTNFGPVQIGHLTGAASGTNLTIELNGNATDAAVIALVQDIQFSSTSHDPTSAVRTVNFTLIDGGGQANSGQDTASFNAFVAVSPVNDAPVAADDIASTDEDSVLTVTGSVLANDTDVDSPHNTLTVSAVNGVDTDIGQDVALASGAHLTLLGDGTYTYDATTSVTFNALAQGDTATDSFQYTMKDDYGATSTATVTITINGVNDAPVAVNDSITTDEDSVVTGSILANDIDVDTPHNGLTVSKVNGAAADVGNQITLASGAHLTLDSSGIYTYDPTSSATFNALPEGQHATDSFQYTVVDDHGATSTATVTITVDGVNDAPVLDTSLVQQSVTGEGGPTTFSGLDVSDVDAGNDPLTLTAHVDHGTLAPVDAGIPGLIIVGGHDGTDGTLEVSGSLSAIQQAIQAGVIVYTPGPPDAPGTPNTSQDTLDVTIDDGHGGSATTSFVFAPTLGDTTLTGTSGNDTFVGSDTGTDTVSYSGTLTVDDLSYDPATNTWTVNGGAEEGTDHLTGIEKVSDGSGNTFFLLVDPHGSYTSIQDAINNANPGDTVLIGAGTYTENVTLKSGVSLKGASEADVILKGTLSTPASFDNATVTNLTVQNVGNGMLLDMRGTSEMTDVAFNHVTFSLSGDFSGEIPIGNGQIAGSIALHDGNNDGASLTFQHVTMASNDRNFTASTAFVLTTINSVGGAKMVLDDVTLSGTASGGATGLGAQWNMTPGNGETASVDIVNSHTSGGGNFYVSGFDGVTIHNNVFDGQGLALNGDKHVTVDHNTFQHISDDLTANGIQHRGLTIEDAWGTNGVSDVTVTNNTFVDITAADGTIAFQRFTDGTPLDTATIDRLNGVDVHGNTFIALGSGVNPVYLNETYFGPGAVLPADFNGAQLAIGTTGNDTISDASTDPVSIFAGAGTDTVNFGAANSTDAVIGISNGHWTVTVDGKTDTLTGVEKLAFHDKTVLLVDQLGDDGGLHSVQTAIDDAAGGDTILVAPGAYTESANYNASDNSNSGTNPLGLLVNKGITIQGVDAAGAPIIDKDHTEATITSAIESGWGTSFFVTADGVTIAGLKFVGTDHEYGQNPIATGVVNKVIEVIADNFTLEHSVVTAPDGLPIGAAIYVNDGTVPDDLTGFVSHISQFNISDNTLYGDFAEANGAGYGQATTSFVLHGNEFAFLTGIPDDWNYGVIFDGKLNDAPFFRAWDKAPVVLPEMTGNTFDADYSLAGLRFLAWDESASNMPSRDYVDSFLANNSVGTYAFATHANGDLSIMDDSGTSFFEIDVTAGQASADAAVGDTLIVQSGNNSSVQTIVTENLTVDAQAGSANLNLLLGSGVHTLTLADYAPDQGANVDVTGNNLGNTITGNSGNNVLTGGTGNDTLTGRAGVDTFVFYDTFGHDTVTDFTVGTDKIELFATAANADFEAWKSAIDDTTGSSVITIDANNTITLANVLKQALTANDFHFSVPT